MNKEELNYKLNMIYEELMTIKEKLEKQERDKRKEKAMEQIEFAKREIKESEYLDNDWYNIREKRIQEFNYKF